MSRVQLALRVADLEGSVAFYSKPFGTEPAKRRPGYANFAIAEPPLKLVLIEGEGGEDTRLDHLGVEVETTEQVTAATARLKEAGPAPTPGLRSPQRLTRASAFRLVALAGALAPAQDLLVSAPRRRNGGPDVKRLRGAWRVGR
ncbi:VOC family protein [Streptomyces sp. L500]